MARKLILPLALAALWLMVLSVPTWQAQFYRHIACYGPVGHGVLCSLGIHWQAMRPRRVHEIAKQHPDDPRLQAIAAERPWDSRQVVKRYEALLDRFPAEAWLHANSLRYRCIWLWEDRPEVDELENRTGDGQGVPTRPRAPATELEQAASFAQKCKHLEPDNAFFDLMHAAFLFYLRRDDEALGALHAAATRPHYNAYLSENMRARLYVTKLATGRQPLAEQKWASWASLLLPHLTNHSRTVGIAIWHARRATERGEHDRALEIYADLTRVAARMRDDSYSLIECLVAIAIQNRTWSWQGDLSVEEKQRVRKDRDRELLLVAEEAGAYASQHGRTDLAQEIIREAEKSTLLRQRAPTLPIAPYPFWPLKDVWVRLSVLSWLGTPMMALILLNLGLWLLLSALLWKQALLGQRVNLLDIMGAVLFALWLPILLLRMGISVTDNESVYPYAYAKDDYHILPVLVMDTALGPVLLTALYCACVTASRRRKALRTKVPSASSSEPPGRPVTCVPPSLIFHPSSSASVTSSILNWGLTLATLVSWGFVIVANITYNRPSWIGYRINIALLLTVACFLGWRTKAILCYPPLSRT